MRFSVYNSGGKCVEYINAPCICNAALKYVQRLPHTAKITIESEGRAYINCGNSAIMSDYTIKAN